MRFRQEKKRSILPFVQLAAALIVIGSCVVIAADAWRQDSLIRQAESFLLLISCCYLGGSAYLPGLAARVPLHKAVNEITPNIANKELQDSLTGLPLREVFHTDLNHYLLESAYPNESTGLCILHINRHKVLSEILGYAAGNQLIKEVSARIAAAWCDQGKVYRIGVDEFAFLMRNYADHQEAFKLAERLLNEMDLIVKLDAKEYHISLSLGLALYPDDAGNAEEMTRFAELAVYYAKEHGLSCCRYAEYMRTLTLTKLELENDLRRGIERQEFFVEYQPQINLMTGRTVGMEALIRWNHPVRGLIPPAEFIPLAEESGLIVQLGEWVLRTACKQNKKWQTEGFEPVSISVNLSIMQFSDSRFSELVSEVLTETGLDPKYLDLEITESMTMDKKSAYEQIKELKRLGIFISIDDFGTGYSSLQYLKHLPIDRIKIDRSFLQEMVENGSDAAIVSSIATIANHLKLKVTAEGVENKEQLEFLKRQNCHDGQGYLFSRPVSPFRVEQDFLVKAAG